MDAKRRRIIIATPRVSPMSSLLLAAPAPPVESSWHSLPEETIFLIFTNLDVIALIETKPVCRQWKRIITNAINAKQIKSFQTNQELRDAAKKYVGATTITSISRTTIFTENGARRRPPSPSRPRPHQSNKITRKDAEILANLYGWPIGKWDVSKLYDFSRVFCDRTVFNDDISHWNVSNAKNMTCMFQNATSFNQNISIWDTSNVTTMHSMFHNSIQFNQNISIWNVSNVTNMCGMFVNATLFQQDLSVWDTSQVTNMAFMFKDAISFNCNLSQWNITNVTSMKKMFYGASTFNQNLSIWDTTNVVSMKDMFTNASTFSSQQDISSWHGGGGNWDIEKL